MPARQFAFVRTWGGRAWRVVDASRRLVLNLVFLLIVIALILAFISSRPHPIAEQTALVLDLKGPIVEQQTGDLRGTALGQLRGQPTKKNQLRDVLAVLDAATTDPHITSLGLRLDDFEGSGLATLREVAAAIDRFKASGKPVIAWGESYDQRQYFLAAHANQLLLDPMGLVYLEGYGRYRNYYRDALDRIGVTVNLIRVGTYKSFAEPYIGNGPSPAAAEADATLYNGLWSTYLKDVEGARKLPPGTLMDGIEHAPQKLAASHGDTAQAALALKEVDALKTRDEWQAMMGEHAAKDTGSKSFRQVSFEDYLSQLQPQRKGAVVGVIVAEGEIVDGNAPGGTVGGLSTSALVRQAREDDNIKAVVLRVNSPGGSVNASEMIRRELELTRKAGKPVVVSMGDVAASGGYWISMSSDEVIADPATITGSIGVFALLPTANKALDKLGVHTAGTGTTWLVGAGDMRRALDPRFAALMQSGIDHVYDEFTSRAAAARKTTPQKIDEVAQGRVWTGTQALQRGLVDRVGSYADAVNAAAARAKLGDDWRVAFVEPTGSPMQRLESLIGGAVGEVIGHAFDGAIDRALGRVLGRALGGVPESAAGGGLTPDMNGVAAVDAGAAAALGSVPLPLARDLQQDFGWLADIARSRRPFTVLAHCLCDNP